jgi:anti-anti-sigma regulatory factor
VAATNAVLPIKQKVDYRNGVYVIFTEPTLAFIGLTEAQAHAKYGRKLKVYRFDYSSMRRALIDGTATGMAKFLCDGRGRLIGAHILGEAAAEVIHEAQVIKAMKKPIQRLNLVTHAYPTYAQALVGRTSQLAFLDTMASSPFVKTALGIFPGLENRLNTARDRLAETRSTTAEDKTAEIDVLIEERSGRKAQIKMNAVYSEESTRCIVDLPEALMDYDYRPILAACAWSGSRNPGKLVLNCGRVRRINGLGASMLVMLSARAKAGGQHLSAFGVGSELRQVFKVTELDKAIDVFTRETDARLGAGISSSVRQIQADTELAGLENFSSWAQPVSELFVPEMPKEARNLNVRGLRAVGPVNGFGRLVRKVFSMNMGDPSVSPEEAIAALKDNFPAFQPSFNRFYPSPGGIRAGEVVLIDSSTPGGPVSTGVMIMYADERSFTFNTPQGHPECGFVSFSAHEGSRGTTVRILGLARAGDPIYEAAFRSIGSRIQTRIWTHVLTSLALHFGVPAETTLDEECVDKTIRWSQIGNLYYNAQIRTLINEPSRWFARP